MFAIGQSQRRNAWTRKTYGKEFDTGLKRGGSHGGP